MYERWGAVPPSHDEHGTEEEIRSNLVATEAHSWRLEGNELVAETNHGILRQRIPPDRILTGTDKNGLPILKKIV